MDIAKRRKRRMRGEERRQRSMLLVINLVERIPQDHPLRRIKQLADAALKELSPLFDRLYSALGRPSIPPERLLKASLMMALYTIRSERMFCEQLDDNLLFPGFWTWSWTSRALTIPASLPTASVCWNMGLPANSFGKLSRRRKPWACCRTIISQLTAP